MKKIRKILYALRPYTIDVYVYTFDLSQPIPEIQPKIDIRLEIIKPAGKNGNIVFSAWHGSEHVNTTHLVFKSLLARQIGFKNVPILGNGETREKFRGNNVHGFMLSSILRHYLSMNVQKRVYMFIAPDNFAVHKVMDKVSCKRMFRVKVSRLLGICVNKEISERAV